MSASGYTPIQLYRTSTAAAVPSASNLASGELAINLTDEKLYFKNAFGVVTLLASSGGAVGTVSSVNASGGTTGLTFSGGPITTSGTLTLAGTLGVANGGTGATSLTSGYLVKGNGTSAASASVVYDDGTNVGIGTGSPSYKLDVQTAANAEVVSRVGSPAGSSAASTMLLTTGTTNSYAFMKLTDNTGSPYFTLGSGPSVSVGYYNFPTHIWTDQATERMRLTSSGNVGIGTSSPYSRFTVVPSSTPTTVAGANQITVGESTANSAYRLQIGYLNNGASGYNGSIQVYDNGNAQSLILNGAGGNVGIGTSSPTSKLQVYGTTSNTPTITNVYHNASGNTFDYGSFSVNTPGAIGGFTVWAPGSARAGTVWFQSVGSYPVVFGVNDSEVARFDTSGNFGIGTSSPSARLDVVGPANTYARINDGTVNLVLQSYTTGSTAIVGTTSAHPLSLWTNAAERMRIDSSGNVGIGTSSPGQKLDVAGSAQASNLLINVSAATIGYADNSASFIVYNGTGAGGITNTIRMVTNGSERARITSSGDLLVGQSAGGFSNGNSMTLEPSAGYCVFNHLNGTASGTKYHYFAYNGGEIGSITQNGTTAVAYNTTSDYRLKDINGPIQNSGAYIDALKPVQGSWKADGSRFIGLIAHEVQEVSETQIATGVKDGEEMQAMDYSAPELIANLIAEIQSLRARVAQLEGK